MHCSYSDVKLYFPKEITVSAVMHVMVSNNMVYK